MAAVQRSAKHSPRTKQRAPSRTGPVEPEDAHGRVVHAIQHVGTGCKVVKLLGEREVARVEDGAQDPGCNPDVREDLVEWPQRVRAGNLRENLLQAFVVCPKVAQGEEHAKGLLHAQKPVKGPFAVELHHAVAGGDAPRRDDVLACVVAFARAIPEEDTSEKCCEV